MLGNYSWPSLVLCPWDGGLLSVFPSFRSVLANLIKSSWESCCGLVCFGSSKSSVLSLSGHVVAHCLLFVKGTRGRGGWRCSFNWMCAEGGGECCFSPSPECHFEDGMGLFTSILVCSFGCWPRMTSRCVLFYFLPHSLCDWRLTFEEIPRCWCVIGRNFLWM